jgi:hypothetical protein
MNDSEFLTKIIDGLNNRFDKFEEKMEKKLSVLSGEIKTHRCAQIIETAETVRIHVKFERCIATAIITLLAAFMGGSPNDITAYLKHKFF